MKTSRFRSGPAWILAAVAIFAGVPLCAQSYGDRSQVLTVGVSQFRGIDGSPSVIAPGDNYLYNPIAGSYWYYLAPLALPEGALIERVCLFGRDTDTGFLTYVSANLYANKLVPLGESPATREVPGSAAFSSGSVGYGSWCSDLSYTVRGTLDVDGDGTPDNAVHYVGLYLPHSLLGVLGFGGVKITWRRQVSSPPSTPTFGDVPAAHPFAPFVEALAASGITAGCGPGKFCPDKPLTRGQMAVFLAKALGLHWNE